MRKLHRNIETKLGKMDPPSGPEAGGFRAMFAHHRGIRKEPRRIGKGPRRLLPAAIRPWEFAGLWAMKKLGMSWKS